MICDITTSLEPILIYYATYTSVTWKVGLTAYLETCLEGIFKVLRPRCVQCKK